MFRETRRANVIVLRAKYNELAKTLRESIYDALPGISELRALYELVEDSPGQVCGICGLNRSERTLLEHHYKSQIRQLEKELSRK